MFDIKDLKGHREPRTIKGYCDCLSLYLYENESLSYLDKENRLIHHL